MQRRPSQYRCLAGLLPCRFQAIKIRATQFRQDRRRNNKSNDKRRAERNSPPKETKSKYFSLPFVVCIVIVSILYSDILLFFRALVFLRGFLAFDVEPLLRVVGVRKQWRPLCTNLPIQEFSLVSREPERLSAMRNCQKIVRTLFTTTEVKPKKKKCSKKITSKRLTPIGNANP